MMKISDLIIKLKEMNEYYPDIMVDIDKVILHISIVEHNAMFITFGKSDQPTENVLLEG